MEKLFEKPTRVGGLSLTQKQVLKAQEYEDCEHLLSEKVRSGTKKRTFSGSSCDFNFQDIRGFFSPSRKDNQGEIQVSEQSDSQLIKTNVRNQSTEEGVSATVKAQPGKTTQASK